MNTLNLSSMVCGDFESKLTPVVSFPVNENIGVGDDVFIPLFNVYEAFLGAEKQN